MTKFEMLPRHSVEGSVLDQNPRYLKLSNFTSRVLPSRRDVLVYLPQAYFDETERSFPVFYLQDGQNIFDPRTSYVPGRTWCAAETADRLTGEGQIEPVILVAVNHGGVRRMVEYTPTRDPRMGGGQGSRYGQLLVDELKPMIDRTFRTLHGPGNTALGGSSLGGLISLWLGLERPEIFGKIAVMSPSVWWNSRAILERVNAAKPKPTLKIWLDMGTAEGLRHLRDTDLLHRRLVLRGWRDGIDLTYDRVEGARHEESAWAERFGAVLQFLFGSV